MVLREIITKGYVVYIDDILIYRKTKEAHDEKLQKVIKLLEEAKLKINQRCRSLSN